MRAHGKLRPANRRVVSTIKAIPTATHMMFVKLYQEGVIKAVISQNCDGLHRRSGLPTKGTSNNFTCLLPIEVVRKRTSVASFKIDLS